jgi:chorismate mutase
MIVPWRVRAIRGATTVPTNSVEAIQDAVTELLDSLEDKNDIDPGDIVSVTFSVTRDLDAIFPAATARNRPGWDDVPLLDVQQMYVQGSLDRCIRLMLHFNCAQPDRRIYHPYLRGACILRPDWRLTQTTVTT